MNWTKIKQQQLPESRYVRYTIYFSGIHRESWHESNESLARDEQNRRNLDLIKKSLLLICLDEPLPVSFNCRLQRGAKGLTAGGRDETNLALQMIHGGGSTYNSGNRWFDKTVQIIVSGDGASGLCYEHSLAEGVAVIQIIEQLLKHANSLPNNSEVPAATGHLPPPERLEWVLEADDYKRIEQAASFLDNLAKDLDFQVFRYANYGKDFMKSCNVSPDVYVQLALQLTYYRFVYDQKYTHTQSKFQVTMVPLRNLSMHFCFIFVVTSKIGYKYFHRSMGLRLSVPLISVPLQYSPCV